MSEVIAEKKKGKKGRVALIAAGLVLVLVLAAAGILAGKYFSAYHEAEDLAEDWKFAEARDALYLYRLVERLDPELTAYLDAGVHLEEGNHEKARELLTPLAQQGYRDVEDLLLEADYQQAEELLEAEEYEAALAVLEILVPQGYRDSDVLLQEAQLGYAMELVNLTGQRPEVRKGLELLEELVAAGYGPAEAALAEAQQITYSYAISLYGKEDYSTAEMYFNLIKGYDRADDYLALISGWLYQGITISEVWALREFADGYALLVDAFYIRDYLEGEWYTADGEYYFTMDANHDVWYNLPWYDGDSYQLYEGILWMAYDDGRENQSQFMFLPVEWDVMTIYCFKDEQFYTLYRQ